MTNNEIKRLGKRIATCTSAITQEDLKSLQEYRKSFKEPLSEVFATLRTLALKVDKDAIVTFRIKRINTIIHKLQRYVNNPVYGSMSLTNMGDIAGCRCILKTNDIEHIYKIRDLLIETYGDNISCENRHDYIKNPKKDGYKSLHLYVTIPQYKRKVEIQIRNTEHHNWATLVEIVDLIFGTKIKEGGEHSELKRFLLLFSQKDILTKEEKELLIKLEQKFKIYKKMCQIFKHNYLNIRKQWILNQTYGFYFIIEAKKDLTSSIDVYKYYDQAENEYYERYVRNKDANIVLTYIKKAKFDQISKAYSNYILAMHSFFYDYKLLIEERVIENINRNIFKLWKYLTIYRYINLLYIRSLQSELQELELCMNQMNIKFKHKNEWKNDIKNESEKWQKQMWNFIKQQVSILHKNDICFFVIKFHFSLLGKQISRSN